MRILNEVDKSRLLEIHNIVKKMEYSHDNLLDIMNYLNESINIAKKISTSRSKNQCLHYLLQTKEKQLDSMFIKDIDEAERESYFQDVKEHFNQDLSLFCDNPEQPNIL